MRSLRRECGDPDVIREKSSGSTEETNVPGVSTVAVDAVDDVGGGAGAGAAAVASATPASVSALASTSGEPRGLRRVEGIPGDEISEDSAVDGRNTAATDKRGLYNLIVPAPTTPEMIRKERRQDNGNSLVRISLYRTLACGVWYHSLQIKRREEYCRPVPNNQYHPLLIMHQLK